jgi:hypothetical protein
MVISMQLSVKNRCIITETKKGRAIIYCQIPIYKIPQIILLRFLPMENIYYSNTKTAPDLVKISETNIPY